MKTKVTVKRSGSGGASYLQQYEYEFSEGMSVLNLLNLLYEQDETLRYDYCCANACCGICGMMCNGVPGLSCRLKAVPDMVLAPLDNLPVLEDLRVDREEYDRKRSHYKLYSSLDGHAACPMGEQAGQIVRQASRCIECLCCLSVCPVFKAKPSEFAGPCHLVLFSRRFFDDRESENRSDVLERMNPQLCIECGRCSKVCPADADPAQMAARLKREVGGQNL